MAKPKPKRKYTRGTRRRPSGAGGIKVHKLTARMVADFWPKRRRSRFVRLWHGYRDSEDIRAEINAIPAPRPVTRWLMCIFASHSRVRRPRSLRSVDWARREARQRWPEKRPDDTFLVQQAIRSARRLDARLPKPSRAKKPKPPKRTVMVIRAGTPPKQPRLARPPPKQKPRLRKARASPG